MISVARCLLGSAFAPVKGMMSASPGAAEGGKQDPSSSGAGASAQGPEHRRIFKHNGQTPSGAKGSCELDLGDLSVSLGTGVSC